MGVGRISTGVEINSCVAQLRPLCSKLALKAIPEMAKPKLNCVSLDALRARSGQMSEHPLYDTWRGMLERCHKTTARSYLRYGAKGITVYEPWRDKTRHPKYKRWSKGFCLFLEYIEGFLGERPEGCSLDRSNSNLGYEPQNLRWANASLQKKNQKVSNKTGYKYVYSISGSVKWQAEYKFQEKRIYVGSFETKEEAYFEALAHRLETMWPKNL